MKASQDVMGKADVILSEFDRVSVVLLCAGMRALLQQRGACTADLAQLPLDHFVKNPGLYLEGYRRMLECRGGKANPIRWKILEEYVVRRWRDEQKLQA
jgi:hypothetical protein